MELMKDFLAILRMRGRKEKLSLCFLLVVEIFAIVEKMTAWIGVSLSIHYSRMFRNLQRFG